MNTLSILSIYLKVHLLEKHNDLFTLKTKKKRKNLPMRQ